MTNEKINEEKMEVQCYFVKTEYLGQNHPIMRLPWIDLHGVNNHLFSFSINNVDNVVDKSYEQIRSKYENDDNDDWIKVYGGERAVVYFNIRFNIFNLFIKDIGWLNEKIEEFVEISGIQRKNEIYIILPLYAKNLKNILIEKLPRQQVVKMRNPATEVNLSIYPRYTLLKEEDGYIGKIYKEENSSNKTNYVVYTKKYDIEEVKKFNTEEEANEYWQSRIEWFKTI